MTAKEVAEFIVARWRMDHTVDAIMMALLLYNIALTKAQIRAVVRRYIDRTTENINPVSGKIPNL